MARTASAFRQSDITRAIKAMRAAGEKVSRVEVGSDGKIIVFAGESAEVETSDLDSELVAFERRNG